MAEVGKNRKGPSFTYVLDFLGSIRCKKVAIRRIDDTCVQQPSCLQRCLLCFLTLPLGSPPLLRGPKYFSEGPRTRSRLPCVHGREERDRIQSRPMGTLCRKCQDIELQFYALKYVTKGKRKREKI